MEGKEDLIFVSYHGACVDGTASAAVFKNKLNIKRFFPVKSRADISMKESILKHLKTYPDAKLYVLDNPFFVEDFAKLGNQIIVLDHHIGEHDNLFKLKEKYSNITYIFDNKKSGATLAWQYLYPGKKIPEVLQRIENVDIWNIQDEQKDEMITAYASMHMDDIDFYVKMIFNTDINELYTKAEPVLSYMNMLVRYYVENSRPIKIRIGKYLVKAYNIATIRPIVSKAANILSKKEGETVAVFKIFNNKTVNLSFRSAGDFNPSAVELARLTGGNGHVRAAGGYMTFKEFLGNIIID